MSKCLICKTEYQPFIDFGKMPIANGFLSEEEFDNEYFYDMEVGFCQHCNMVQLVNQPDREMMFNENYAFFSGTSQNMALHFKEFADGIKNHYLMNADPFVVEIGSNDGIMLKNFARQGVRHLGVEPSQNVADVAIREGVNTVTDFFDSKLAGKIVSEYGQADAFIAANVMCHIPYFHSIIDGIKILLKKDGIAAFEDPYLGEVIENTTYDQIYDEHVFLFSLLSIQYAFQMHDMEVVDVDPQETHGGSMRYFIAHKGAKKVSQRVLDLIEKEKQIGLNKGETYDVFRQNCERYRDSLVDLVKKVRRTGNRIVGYAATSKSTTILNYCGLDNKDIEFISDTTPIKQGKFSPGAHIPVRHHDYFSANYPEYALLFAYNHAQEIMGKEQAFMDSGGKWIVYVPEVKVL